MSLSQMFPKLKPLDDFDKEQFQMVVSSVFFNTLAVVSSVRKRDGQPVTLLCLVDPTVEPGQYRMVPMAELIKGDGSIQYEDPLSDQDVDSSSIFYHMHEFTKSVQVPDIGGVDEEEEHAGHA